MTTYPIIANCNYESADDTTIHEIRCAVDAGLTDDPTLRCALDALEETLGEYAEAGDVESMRQCAEAEADVLSAWTETVQSAVDAARKDRWDRGE